MYLMLKIRENVFAYFIILNIVSDCCPNHGYDLLAILNITSRAFTL